MRGILATLVAFACGFAVAEDFYWSGKGGDNRWDNKDNWATDAALTKPASRCPASGLKVYFILDTFANHEVSVIMPDGATCGYIYVKDNTAPATLVLAGEGASRATFTNTNGISFDGSAASYGVTLRVSNISFAKKLFGTPGSIPGTRVCIDNCACDYGTADFSLMTGADSEMVINDSQITNYKTLSRGSTSENFILAVTNSILTGTSGHSIRGRNARIDFQNSTVTAAGNLTYGENEQARDANAGMRVSFVDTTIVQNKTKADLRCYSTGREILMDNVTISGEGYFTSLVGGVNAVTRLINTELYFNRGGASTAYPENGEIYLDNSCWIVTNGYSSSSSEDPVRFVIKGRSSRAMPGLRWQGGSVRYDFIVPVGGYDQIPVGCDGVLSAALNNFFNAGSGGAIRVLPESPAARVDETTLVPLIYVYKSSTEKLLGLSACPPTELPNGDSRFLVTSVTGTSFAEVRQKPESWWKEVDIGYNASEVGLAVKIVGSDSRLPVVRSLTYVGSGTQGAAFNLDLANLGETPEGGSAASVDVALLIRPVGTESWTACPQSSITAIGTHPMVVGKDLIPTPGNYEIGVRLSNDLSVQEEYLSPDPVVIDFTRPTVSALAYVGEGIEATISGRVTGTGGEAAAPVVLEVSESADFSTGVTSYEIGSLAAGADFTKTVVVNPGAMTYYRVTVGEGSTAAVATASGSTRTVATLGTIKAVNTNGLCRVVVDGSVVARGAGDSTVKLRYSMDGVNWLTNVVGTVSADGTDFTGECAYPMPGGTAYYEVFVENVSGDFVWTAAGGVQTMAVKDYSTYYWRDVDGEWNGNWNDGRHWFKPDLPDDVTAYPQVNTATASFRDCPATEEGVVVTLPVSVTVKQVESVAAGQRLTLKGSSEVTLTASIRLNQANGVNTFDGLVVNGSAGDVNVTGAGCTYVLEGGAEVTLKSFYARVAHTLTVGEDCVMTILNNGQEGGQKNILVDNGKLVHTGFVGQNSASGSVVYTLRGKKARVEFSGSGSSLNNSWKNVKFVFEIPEGGYADVPVALTKGPGVFMMFANVASLLASNFGKEGDDNGLIYAIANNSPALLSAPERNITQDLFVWAKLGWAADETNADPKQRYNLIDYTKLQVPATTSEGKRVKSTSLMIRGIDEVSYASPAALKAAGTTAYAVSYTISKNPGFMIRVR